MAVLLALAAALSWGVSDFLGGLAEGRTDEDRTGAITAWTMGIGLIGLSGLSLLVGGQLGVGDALVAALGGVGGAVGVAALYRGLAVGTIAVVAPITGVLAAALPVLAGVVRGERPTSLAWIGIAAALGSIVLVARERPDDDGVRPVNARALVYAVTAGVGFAAIFLVLDAMPEEAGLWPLVPMKLGGVLAALVWISSQHGHRLPARATWPLVIGVGVLDNAANVAYLLATREGLLALVAVLASLYPAFTVLMARVVLGERLERPQVAGMLLAGAGVALIAAA